MDCVRNVTMQVSRHSRLAIVIYPALVAVFAFGVAPDSKAGGAEGSPAKKTIAKPDYLDTMIQEAWDSASIKPSAVAPDAEFLRRVYVDLLGRIPTVQEALAFLESK